MRTLLVPVFVLGLLTGCTAAADPTPTATVASATRSASATPTPTPSPSPSPTAVESFPAAPATETAEQAEIRAAWMEYWRVYEKFAADPSQPDWTETQYVTTEESATIIIQAIGNLKDRGWRSLGGRQFRDVVVSQPTAGPDGSATAVVTYCLDRTGVRLVEVESGDSVQVDVAPTFKETATLKQGADGKWRVAMIRNEPSQC